MIKQIFICDTFTKRGIHLSISKPDDSNVMPQIVLMDETDRWSSLGPKSVARMKQFLNGDGFPFDIKWGEPEIWYEGCPMIMTSNGVPFDGLLVTDSYAMR
jgi:hypothetical protein